MRPTQLAAILSLTMSLGACATILHGSTEPVMISSIPSGATVTMPGGAQAVTPATVHLSRRSASTLTISKPGYQAQKITLTPHADHTLEATLGNWWNGFLPGAVFDFASGGANRLDHTHPSAVLQPAP